jgi:predicted small secreted protein
MPKAVITIACIFMLTLSGCGNTAYGLKKDGQETSHALDNATHRVLSAGANKK